MAKITICHQPPGQTDTWNLLSVDTNSLSGHDNHSGDIWPTVPGVTEGMNWDAGGLAVWANGCVTPGAPTPTPTPTLTSTPTPAPTLTSTPTPTPTTTGAPMTPPSPPLGGLPVTGIDGWWLMCAVLIVVVGVALYATSWRRR